MGAGINLFRQLFPNDFYSYQTASLESSKPVSKKIYDSNNNVIAEYPLGSDELRGLLKIENGNLVAFGDVHNSDGTGVKYFGIVDLGSLNWTNDTTAISGIYNLKADLPETAKPIPVTDIFTAICAVYKPISAYDVYNCNEGICANADGISIFVYDANYNTSSSATAFKTAMSGKYLIYELANPTPTTYTPFTNPMISGSTEEFTDTRSVKMPCGHDSLYYSSPFKGW